MVLLVCILALLGDVLELPVNVLEIHVYMSAPVTGVCIGVVTREAESSRRCCCLPDIFQDGCSRGRVGAAEDDDAAVCEEREPRREDGEAWPGAELHVNTC